MKEQNVSKFIFWSLVAAGLYNILWGAWVIFFPALSFTLLGAEPPRYLELWQCIGMIVGVYGLGYIIAASNPNRHWPIVLVGLLGKIFGPIGFVKALYDGVFPLSFGINIIFNDLIWWVPFFLALKGAYKNWLDEDDVKMDVEKVMNVVNEHFDSNDPKLMLALRHHGCTFTREALNSLKQLKDEINEKGWKLLLVNMDSSGEFDDMAKKYLGNEGWASISDPDRSIYKSMGLRRGGITEVLGPKDCIRGFSGIVKGYGIGPLRGDGMQLAGMMLIDQSGLRANFQANSSSDPFPLKKWVKEL